MEAIEDESFVILGASMSDFDERQFRLMSSMNGVKDDGDPLVESTTTMNGHSSLSGGAGISLCSINTVELVIFLNADEIHWANTNLLYSFFRIPC